MRRSQSGWLVVLKVLVSALAVFFVGWELLKHQDELVRIWTREWGLFSTVCLVLGIALMPVNYALETQKWRVAVAPFYPGLGFLQAFTAVFAGMASGIWTPNRVGEYAGRVVFLEEGQRFEAIVATFFDRICQLMITISMGLAALVVLILSGKGGEVQNLMSSEGTFTIFVVMSVAIGMLLALFLASPRFLSKSIPSRWNASVWIRKLRFALSRLPISTVAKVIALSWARYLIFATQYWLLMVAFQFEGAAWMGYSLVALVFLGKSVLPVMGIFELGVREWVAVMVMGIFGQNGSMAASATFILYLVNILLPSLVGVLALHRLKAV